MESTISSLYGRIRLTLESFVSSIKRFPLTYLFAFATTLCIIYFIEEEAEIRHDAIRWSHIIKLILSFYIAFLGFLATRVFLQTRASGKRYLAYFLIPLLISAIYYFSLPNNIQSNTYFPVFRFICFAFIGHLIISVIPFNRNYSNSTFWEYNKAMFIHFFIAAFYAIVLYAGLCIALVSINYLFDYHIKSTLYADVAIAVFGLFLTYQFLVRFPKLPFTDERKVISPLFSILVNYILIPLMCLYFIIAYGFMIKLMVEGAWPEGWVSSLIVGFIVAGTIVFLLNYGMSEKQTFLSGVYDKGFKYSLIPLAVLLLLAVYRRIADYGLTEERYLLIFIGIWALLAALYYIFFKKSVIAFIPLSLILFTLVLSLGPFNAEQISIKNQKSRLIKKLVQSGNVVDGKMDPSIQMDNPALIRSVNNTLKYLESRNKLSVMQPVLSDNQLSELPGDADLWESADLLRIMGIRASDAPLLNTKSERRFAFELSSDLYLDISDYDELLVIHFPAGIEKTFSGLQAKLVEDEIHVYDKNVSLDIIPLESSILSLYESMLSKGFVGPKEALFNSESDVFSSSLFVQKFDISYDDEKLNIYAFKAILLLNRK